jgi:NADH dehydrogenase
MAEGLIPTGHIVTVFGGSGFIGRQVVRKLAKRGWRIRVATRRPDLAFHLQPSGRVGQIHAVQANLRNPASVARALQGSQAIVNLVGILAESGRQNFEAVHAFGARAVARAAQEAGITRLVHMSALGADPNSPADYARTKSARRGCGARLHSRSDRDAAIGRVRSGGRFSSTASPGWHA